MLAALHAKGPVASSHYWEIDLKALSRRRLLERALQVSLTPKGENWQIFTTGYGCQLLVFCPLGMKPSARRKFQALGLSFQVGFGPNVDE